MLAKSRQPMGNVLSSSQAGDKAPMSKDPTITTPISAANAVALPMQGQFREEHEEISWAVKFVELILFVYNHIGTSRL